MSAPLSGARAGKASWLRRLLARAVARDLRAFVVPGPEVARALGADLQAAGLRLCDTPRHASVLVLVGELPGGLKNAAAVAYAQMPRPRAILAVGTGDVSPLPGPDAAAGLDGATISVEELATGVSTLRRGFAEGAFAEDVAGFDVDAVRTKTQYVCPMHQDVIDGEPGSCPRCGMDLVPREAAGDMGHDQVGHGNMDHGDMGFMSMVEMTRGLPRGSDGLQMERIEVPFGPLFPGLPAGLYLRIILDGDTVAETEADGVGGPAREDVSGPVGAFAGRLARLDPLSPVAYRLLALRAVEEATGIAADEREALARAGALERERAASHLNWVASLAHLLGYAWLERRATRLQLALLRAADAEEAARLRPDVSELARRVERTPLLGRKLRGSGSLPGNALAPGPVARARGERTDVRAKEGVYRDLLGFEPVVREGDDAFSRLLVRLEEAGQSLELVRGADSISFPAPELDGAYPDGTGTATVETPRGAATLRVMLERGRVRDFGLEAPSARHLGLLRTVTEGEELGNALVGVASLDLSPWGAAR